MKNARSALFALLAVLGLGLVVRREIARTSELRAMSHALEFGSELPARLAELEQRNRLLESELAAARRIAHRAPDPDATETAAADEAPRDPRRGWRETFDRPEVRQLRALQQRAALDARYGPLFKALGLDSARLARVKEILLERDATLQDVFSLAREQGIDPRREPEALRSLVSAAQADLDADLQNALGDAGFADYRNYQSTLGERSVVQQLQQSLGYTAEPLTDAQASRLVEVLATHAPPTSVAAMSLPGPPLEGMPGGFGRSGSTTGTTITDAAVQEARTLLNSAQFDALVQLQELQQAQQAAQRTLRDSMIARGPGRG